MLTCVCKLELNAMKHLSSDPTLSHSKNIVKYYGCYETD